MKLSRTGFEPAAAADSGLVVFEKLSKRKHEINGLRLAGDTRF